ncbi:hypothetical protein BH18ACT6_BH18ACT6_22520 [soil metagenome]
MLPVLAFDGREFSIAGNLAPAYEIGGDTFDYAVEPHTLSVTITDAQWAGHGVVLARGSTSLVWPGWCCLRSAAANRR